MAGKAIISPHRILNDDVNTSGDYSVTLTVHYLMPGVSEEEKDISVNCGWPGLTSIAFHQSMADEAIAQQPSGYSMTRADVLLPLFAKASVI